MWEDHTFLHSDDQPTWDEHTTTFWTVVYICHTTNIVATEVTTKMQQGMNIKERTQYTQLQWKILGLRNMHLLLRSTLQAILSTFPRWSWIVSSSLHLSTHLWLSSFFYFNTCSTQDNYTTSITTNIWRTSTRHHIFQERALLPATLPSWLLHRQLQRLCSSLLLSSQACSHSMVGHTCLQLGVSAIIFSLCWQLYLQRSWWHNHTHKQPHFYTILTTQKIRLSSSVAHTLQLSQSSLRIWGSKRVTH